MKKLILFMAVIACALSASAQDSLYIYKTGGPIDAKLISTIDSITFSSKQDSLYIHHSGIITASYVTSVVDSISFTRTKIAQSTTVDNGVVINGVRWATRNINTTGTFATAPEGYGYFYQWNSKIGWSSSDPLTPSDGKSTWNSNWNGGFTNASATDTWVTANDPSPAGWRVPTYAEIETLLDATKVTHTWTTQNGVYGEKFTDNTTGNSLFLPASGYRGSDAGTLNHAGSFGYYWGSAAYNSGSAYSLYFYSSGANWNYLGRVLGFAVRPVAE